MVRPANRFDVFRRMLADLGFTIQPHMKVLEFGAGEGKLVACALAQGFDAYGCDLYDVQYSYTLTRDPTATALRDQGRLKPIQTPYRLPFEDASIDVVFSDQVFEHVMNYPQAIDELRRVLRPGGVFVHAFPSRYLPIEGHIYVPLAALFRPRWWLWLWALLGVRNEFQQGMPAAEVVEKNVHFLKNGTNYPPTRQVKREFARCFSRVEFVERVFLPYSNRPRFLAKVPFGAALYGLLWGRFLFGMRSTVPESAPSAAVTSGSQALSVMQPTELAASANSHAHGV
jgi:SAM-dependent methyltransferase